MDEDAYQVYECWYVVNKTEESLRIIAIDMDKKLLPGDTIPIYGRHRDVDKDFDKLILDFSCFYTRRYGTHKDIILCDSILKEILAWKYETLWINEIPIDQTTPWEQRNAFLEEQQMLNIPIEVIIAVTDRHFKSEFKRKQLPIKLERNGFLV